MADIDREIGDKIRTFRKKKGMTLADISKALCKSKATVSKYERGEIAIDIVTLYEIADVLHVHVNQLLYFERENDPTKRKIFNPAFFSGINQFYSYLYDGRANKIMKCVFDIIPTESETGNNIYMYMNFKDYDNYQNCENTYHGIIEHYDALTNIVMRNQDTYMEQVTASILASFLDSSTKWGLFFGLSSRPMMPIAVKMLFSRHILKEDDELVDKLKVSKEDIRLLKHYNMLSVT
ncbi:helix-turn-helix domain-containing protein [Paenibacillus oralis]|uniref:Helix-turn-helix domain-containing protein n=1 Tax=Paenibacillus oralis TaxID=2490856 RepID=A0A3P3U426_9BACL|nr:helix-turn-helix domain-containing protein [Paenibacillus oralis]RRJ65117.1 helix-turn-helix domain-containing protein [Paenibacillus oralis]